MTMPGDRPSLPDHDMPRNNPDTPSMPGNLPERLPGYGTPTPEIDPPTNPDLPGMPEPNPTPNPDMPPMGDPMPSPAM